MGDKAEAVQHQNMYKGLLTKHSANSTGFIFSTLDLKGCATYMPLRQAKASSIMSCLLR